VTIELRTMVEALAFPSFAIPADKRLPIRIMTGSGVYGKSFPQSFCKWASDSTPPSIDCGAVLLPPFHLLVLKAHLYSLNAIPLLMLFVDISLFMVDARTPEILLHVDNG
jgi:hypothetical protein